MWRIGLVLPGLALLAGCSHQARAWAAGTEAACHAQLQAASVRFAPVPHARASGVTWPIELTGLVLGVRVHGAKKGSPTNYLDCQLGLALAEWAPHLLRQGVVGLEHYSMYRRDARVGRSTKLSGHALGRAIDIGAFELRDGRKLNVLKDWTNRKRGADPCDVRSSSEAERIMRNVVCEATDRELFQMILTPHYNDAHKDHVHLEIGESAGSWID